MRLLVPLILVPLIMAAAAAPLPARGGAFDTVRLVRLDSVAADTRTGAVYRAGYGVETPEGAGSSRRFSVRVPDAALLPVAKRAGQFLGILWTLADQRLSRETARLREAPVDVWLTAMGEAGGEQANRNLYIYNAAADRTGLEWARELAHEYGHYLLPGASGFTDPESWSNGLLGERLFLSWLRDAITSARVDPDELPFVKPADLDRYCERQVTPLIDQMREHGPDRAALARTDKSGMNAFSALILYVDRVYGGRAIPGMLEYLPRAGSGRITSLDFLAGLTNWLDRAERFTIASPGGGTFMAYLPAGLFQTRSVSPRTADAQPQTATVTRRILKPGWTMTSQKENSVLEYRRATP